MSSIAVIHPACLHFLWLCLLSSIFFKPVLLFILDTLPRGFFQDIDLLEMSQESSWMEIQSGQLTQRGIGIRPSELGTMPLTEI
jgi:hypothetical protein